MHLLKTVFNYQYDFWRTADGLGPIQMNLPEMGCFQQLSCFQPALLSTPLFILNIRVKAREKVFKGAYPLNKDRSIHICDSRLPPPIARCFGPNFILLMKTVRTV